MEFDKDGYEVRESYPGELSDAIALTERLDREHVLPFCKWCKSDRHFSSEHFIEVEEGGLGL